VTIALIFIAVLHSVMLLFPQLQPGAFRPDFSVFWTGARLVEANAEQLYDAQAITAAQSWLTSPTNGLRPFVYPPSALLFFYPFGFMSFPVAFLVWTLLSVAAFAVAARNFATQPELMLAFATPAIVLSVASGQTSLLIASAIMGAITLLERKPTLAGVLLGAAASLKPQAVLLVPLALLIGRHWRAQFAFFVTGIICVAGAMLLWGVELWFDWYRAMSQFSSIVTGLGLNIDGITFAMLAKAAGWPAWLALSIQLAAILCGCALVVWAFRRPDKSERVVALASGSLLCSPYALIYDLSVLMPIAVGLLIAGRSTGIFAGFAITGLAGAFAVPAVIASSLTGRLSDRTGRVI
jgi:Glycosyltransferase family 87